MHTALAILFVSYVLFMYFGGFFGFIKAKPFKFSDKVDLFYVEPRPRKIHPHSTSGDVRVRSVNRQPKSKPRLQWERLSQRLPEKSLPVVTGIKPKVRASHQRPVERQPAPTIERNVFEECVAALKQLGYGTNANCKRIVSKHISGVSVKINSCEDFLESFLKLESSNEHH